jgi:hypothetical protein
MDGKIISLLPSSEILQAYISVVLHTHFLDAFSSIGMASFLVPPTLTKVV